MPIISILDFEASRADLHPTAQSVLVSIIEFVDENEELFGEDDVFTPSNRYLQFGFNQLCDRLVSAAKDLLGNHVISLEVYQKFEAINQNILKDLDYTQPKDLLLNDIKHRIKTYALTLSDYLNQYQNKFTIEKLKTSLAMGLRYSTPNLIEENGFIFFEPMLAEQPQFSNCKLHLSTRLENTEKMFNSVAGILYRYFPKFKVISPESPYHQNPSSDNYRFANGGQITILLSDDLTIEDLEKILPKISSRLKNLNIPIGTLESDASTRFDYISMRYDTVFNEYLPVKLTGRNYNPLNEQSKFNALLKNTNSEFSMISHFDKFNLEIEDFQKQALMLTLTAYLRKYLPDDKLVVIFNKDIRVLINALDPNLAQADIEDIKFLIILIRYMKESWSYRANSENSYKLIFSTCYSGENAQLRDFFSHVDKKLGSNEIDKDFGKFYIESICRNADEIKSKNALLELSKRIIYTYLWTHDARLISLIKQLFEIHPDLVPMNSTFINTSLKIIKIFEILEISMDQKDEAIKELQEILSNLEAGKAALNPLKTAELLDIISKELMEENRNIPAYAKKSPAGELRSFIENEFNDWDLNKFLETISKEESFHYKHTIAK